MSATTQRTSACTMEPLEQRQLLSASMLKDAVPGASGLGSVYESVEMRGELYMATPYGLFKTDGTSSGTRQITSSTPSHLSVLGKSLYFVSGGYVWTTKGTTGSTKQVSTVVADDLVAFDGKLIFRGYDNSSGYEVWTSKGTAKSTTTLTDVSSTSFYGAPANFTAVGNKLYFTADTAEEGTELWVTDGTRKGTRLVEDINLGVSDANITFRGSVGDYLLFTAYDPATGTELWASNGTKKGTVLLNDMTLGTSGSSFTGSVVNHNGAAYMIINGDIWTTKGTAKSTKRIFDSTSSATSLDLVGKQMIFMTSNSQMWKTKGSENSTEFVMDMSSLFYYTSYKAVSGKRLFFTGYNSTTGYELWVTKGTESSTKLVKDIYTGTSSSTPQNIFAVGNIVLFHAQEQLYGRELWRSDGSEGGTVRVKDINPGVTSSSFEPVAIYNDSLIFLASDGVKGTELWKFRDDGLDLAGNSIKKARKTKSYAAGSVFLDHVSKNDDRYDYYTFNAKKNQKVNILLEGLDSNANLELIQDKDGDGKVDKGEVLFSSKKTGKKVDKIKETLAKGTYIVRVVKSGSGETDYSLKFA